MFIKYLDCIVKLEMQYKVLIFIFVVFIACLWLILWLYVDHLHFVLGGIDLYLVLQLCKMKSFRLDSSQT